MLQYKCLCAEQDILGIHFLLLLQIGIPKHESQLQNQVFVLHKGITKLIQIYMHCVHNEVTNSNSSDQACRSHKLSSEFAICHVVRHGNVSGRRVQLGSIVGLVKVEGF